MVHQGRWGHVVAGRGPAFDRLGHAQVDLRPPAGREILDENAPDQIVPEDEVARATPDCEDCLRGASALEGIEQLASVLSRDGAEQTRIEGAADHRGDREALPDLGSEPPDSPSNHVEGGSG